MLELKDVIAFLSEDQKEIIELFAKCVCVCGSRPLAISQ